MKQGWRWKGWYGESKNVFRGILFDGFEFFIPEGAALPAFVIKVCVIY